MSAMASAPRDPTETRDRITLERRIEILEIGHAHMTRQMAEITVALQDVSRCLEAGTSKMSGLERELSDNSSTTREVRDILSTARLGFRVLGGLGTAVRWFGYLASAGAACYVAWHMIVNGGRPPGGGG